MVGWERDGDAVRLRTSTIDCLELGFSLSYAGFLSHERSDY
jgi:hypothetical protein